MALFVNVRETGLANGAALSIQSLIKTFTGVMNVKTDMI